MATKKKEPSFEEGMERLEQLTEEMEKGDAPLERLLELHAEGTELAASLRKRLEGAQARLLEVREGAQGKLEVKAEAHSEQLEFLGGE